MFSVLPLAFAVASALAGDPAFDEAMKLYKALEYEEAIPKLATIANRPGLSANDKATAFMWLGLSQAGAGDMDNARLALAAALDADSTITLPEKVSPRISAMFDQLKADAAAKNPPPPPNDPPPPEEPPPPSEPLSMTLVGGGVAAGVGVVALIGGCVLAVLAAGELETANDRNQFQSDAKAALDTANGEVAGAAVLLPLGAALAAAGGVLIGLSMTE
jgi:hypothetical protein